MNMLNAFFPDYLSGLDQEKKEQFIKEIYFASTLRVRLLTLISLILLPIFTISYYYMYVQTDSEQEKFWLLLNLILNQVAFVILGIIFILNKRVQKAGPKTQKFNTIFYAAFFAWVGVGYALFDQLYSNDTIALAVCELIVAAFVYIRPKHFFFIILSTAIGFFVGVLYIQESMFKSGMISLNGLWVSVLCIFISRYLWKSQVQEFNLRTVIATQKSEIDRLSIMRDMHDDIGPNLTKIVMLSNISRSNEHELNQKNTLDKISNAANEIIDSIGEISWAVNPDHDTLDNLISYLRGYISDYSETSGYTCHLNMPDNLELVKVPLNIRRNVFLVVKEALHNVVKHSCAKNLIVQATYINKLLDIKIQDDGKGFSSEHVVAGGDHSLGGHGIINMKKRMDSISGKFEILSGYSGTTIMLSVGLE